jgi:uncharacterized protein (TIGR04222 family)
MAMEPWGISGTLFILLYIGGVIGAIWISALVRKAMWARPGREIAAPLSEDEVAYLCGGDRRVVDTAIARLVERESLRVERSGVLTATGGPASTELEEEILGTVQSRPRTAGEINCTEHHSVRQARQGLLERGLLATETPAQSFLVTLPVLVVFLVGIARLVNGIALGRPVVFLIIALVITFFVLLGTFAPDSHRRTRAGDQLAAKITTHLPISPLVGAAGLVAIGGFGLFPDQAIATALTPPATASANDAGGGDSGGGDSGGGGCGGGCGGCGGCGG